MKIFKNIENKYTWIVKKKKKCSSEVYHVLRHFKMTTTCGLHYNHPNKNTIVYIHV